MQGTARRVSGLLFLVGTLVVLSGATCLGPVGGDTTPDKNAGFADQVIELVNTARADNGLPPFAKSDVLMQMADAYATRMADRNFCSHVDPDTGLTAFDRAIEYGYQYSLLGENIAAGQTTPKAVMDGWMNSPGHRANILSADLTEIGVGVHEGGSLGIYWCQEFGTPE